MKGKKGKRALVTGAGGFIGGHLVARLLYEDYTVTAVDRKSEEDWHQWNSEALHLVERRVRDYDMKSLLEDVDEVYHLAADMGGIGYITNHLTSCASNVVDTVHLLDACHAGQRVFFASSACVYRQDLQKTTDDVRLSEWDAYPADPEPGYGWEKLYGEQLMAWHRQERGIETRVARYHNVAGPHGEWKGGREKAPAAICRKVATAVITGEHEIEIWGDGEQTRSFMDVLDCVYGTLLIARGDHAAPLNLGSDRSVTVNELVSMVEGFAGVELHRRYRPDMPQGVRGRNSDNRLMRNVFDWAPNNDIERWLEPTYHWIFNEVAKEL